MRGVESIPGPRGGVRTFKISIDVEFLGRSVEEDPRGLLKSLILLVLKFWWDIGKGCKD